MSRTASPQADGRFLVFAGVIVAGFVAVLIAGVVMGIAMGNQMGSGGMMGMMNRAGNSGQTPVVVDAPELQIEIRGFEFFPNDVSVLAGTKVTWINRESAPHTATQRQGDWDTGVLNEGESKTLTFDKAGAYEYICAIHPSMQAKITVR